MEFRTEFADYKDELAFLRAYLTEQGYLYYVLDAPVIPGGAGGGAPGGDHTGFPHPAGRRQNSGFLPALHP